MTPSKIILVAILSLFANFRLRADTLFVEAESFRELGGWSLDTAATQIVGSPYLLAHGMGQPVSDATTQIEVAHAGTYRVWVRTKDWVAHWDAPGTPGRFKLIINNKPIVTEFGTEGADWHWHFGGDVHLNTGINRMALQDLTGFDGRCDAILLSDEADFAPPTGAELTIARRKWLNLAAEPQELGPYDLVVVGGGYSGMGAAISAARQSLKVAFIQDRFVLGGNGSSEVRVWANGGTMRGKFPRLGEIIEEFADHAADSPGIGDQFGDDLKQRVIEAEPNIALFLGHFAHDVTVEYETNRIIAVKALDVRTGQERVFHAPLFVDCTGHGEIGSLAGADFEIETNKRMGMSNCWYWQEEATEQLWPKTPWALPLALEDFPATTRSKSEIDNRPFMKAEWFWESGFNKDSIQDLEYIRDWNLRAAFGAFSAMKHGLESDKYRNAAFKWIGHVGGTRESRRLLGDVQLSRDDIVNKSDFPDGTVPTTWDIDLHYAKEQFAKKFPDNPFISRAEFGSGVDRKQGYPVPYRCFYSRNIPNLFMAGRCISVSHEALGTVRVMRTCGMMGEVVGKAAYLCRLHDVTPRGVYEQYLPELLKLCEQPGAMRRGSMDAELVLDQIAASRSIRPYFNKGTDKIAGTSTLIGVPLSTLTGIVVDDSQTKISGDWSNNGSLEPFVGDGYLYAAANSNSQIEFGFSVAEAGSYEVRMAWVGHENRGSRVPCDLVRPGQDKQRVWLDQKSPTDSKQAFQRPR